MPLANSATITWTQTAVRQNSSFQSTNQGIALVQTFQVGTTNATVCTIGRMSGKSLVLSVTCDQPFVQTFYAGEWGPTLRRRQMVVPYFPGAVYYLSQENLFTSAFLDWTASSASSQDSTRAYYNALTDGSRNCLRERVIFSAAWHQAEVFPNNPNPPSPYLDFLANKVVLDIWGGSFTNIANTLTNLADYGITNCVALEHDWQRSGYDNALPAHLPAQAGLGGDPGMSNLVATGTSVGIRVGLHENYVDYYPNYDFYNTNDIALDSQGNLVLAWYNPGTKIQSFAIKPNAVLRLAATQSLDIHSRYHTAAMFLDVDSSVPPWFHVDYRAGEAGAGMFSSVWNVHRQLWAYERTTHNGPVFGEGNNHWYWSGCLDGVEAQYGSGWPGNGGFTAPLHVDFDLLKIHPLQFNHGMGYHSRWWSSNYETNWAGPPPMVVLDQYRVQQVAYGHAGFLDSDTYSQVPFPWLEHHLLLPVTARYGNARPVNILYEQGGNWIDPTAAAKSETNRDRVCITYENGLTITANDNSNTLAVNGFVLPQFGWLAQGAGVSAGTVMRDGEVTDFADAGDTLFVNARSAADWNLSSFHNIHPKVEAFQQTAARTFQVTYGWETAQSLPKDYNCFVHFCQTNIIKFQQDHALSPGTSQWLAGQTNADGPYTVNIATNTPDGNYDWLIGLWDPDSGARLRLLGIDDGQSRIRLGTLGIQSNGMLVTFVPEPDTNYPVLSVSYLAHLNDAGKTIDFGDVRTDGSAWLHRDGGEWVLKTWPRDRNFTLELTSARFGTPAKVRCSGGSTNELSTVALGNSWRLPLNGASEYRWDNVNTNKTPHGVPYSWLNAAGITNDQDQVENNDPDNDGMATWQEYYAGTDPTNAGSAFKIVALGGNGGITWYGTTNSGVTNAFRVYRCTNLLAANWQLAASNILRSGIGINAWTDTGMFPRVFYRVATQNH
jgi:hypothetical protein